MIPTRLSPTKYGDAALAGQGVQTPWPMRCLLVSSSPGCLGCCIPTGSWWSQILLALGMGRGCGYPWVLSLCGGTLLVLIASAQWLRITNSFRRGACESRVEAGAGTPWRTLLNTLPNRNPARQQVSLTQCCQQENTDLHPCRRSDLVWFPPAPCQHVEHHPGRKPVTLGTAVP